MEGANENEVTLQKIHLKSFIEVLVSLYEQGVDFVDICGKNNTEQDIIDIRFSREYTVWDKEEEKTKEEIEEEIEEEPEDVPTKINLSDDNLNQLI